MNDELLEMGLSTRCLAGLESARRWEEAAEAKADFGPTGHRLQVRQ